MVTELSQISEHPPEFPSDRSVPIEQQTTTLGRCVRLMTSIHHRHLKELVSEMLYAICDSDGRSNILQLISFHSYLSPCSIRARWADRIRKCGGIPIQQGDHGCASGPSRCQWGRNQPYFRKPTAPGSFT